MCSYFPAHHGVDYHTKTSIIIKLIVVLAVDGAGLGGVTHLQTNRKFKSANIVISCFCRGPVMFFLEVWLIDVVVAPRPSLFFVVIPVVIIVFQVMKFFKVFQHGGNDPLDLGQRCLNRTTIKILFCD